MSRGLVEATAGFHPQGGKRSLAPARRIRPNAPTFNYKLLCNANYFARQSEHTYRMIYATNGKRMATGHPGTAEHVAAVIQRRSEPGNGQLPTIRTELIGIRLEGAQVAARHGDSGKLSFTVNHWETLPCVRSIKMRLLPSYCVVVNT